MHTLSSLKPASGSTKKRKRVGRGDGSGHGTYSTRGMKGQKSRTGGRSGIQKRALKEQILLRTPKVRGFKSLRPGFEAVNLVDLQAQFAEGEAVTIAALARKGLVRSPRSKVKILGQGELSKMLVVSAHAFSAHARKAITAKSGKIVIL